MGLKGATSGTLTAYTNRTKPSSLEARALNSTLSPMIDSATVSVNQIRRTSLSATGYANGRSSIVTHADMIAQQTRLLGPRRGPRYGLFPVRPRGDGISPLARKWDFIGNSESPANCRSAARATIRSRGGTQPGEGRGIQGACRAPRRRHRRARTNLGQGRPGRGGDPVRRAQSPGPLADLRCPACAA